MAGNYLQQLMGGAPRQNSEEQLKAMQSRTYSPALERQARAAGFKSAAEYVAWSRQRSTPAGGTVPRGGNPGAGPTVMGTQPMAMHPKNILNYVLQKMQGATGP